MTAPHFELERVSANVSSINQGREKVSGDELRTRFDINCIVQVSVEALAQLAEVGDEAPDYQHTFWGDDGKPLASGMELMHFNREFEGHFLVIDNISGQKRYLTKVIKKFKAEPTHGGRVDLAMQIQIIPANAVDMWELSKMALDDHDILIERPSQTDIEEGEPEEEGSNVSQFPAT